MCEGEASIILQASKGVLDIGWEWNLSDADELQIDARVLELDQEGL
jgi:hypothetical protein